MELQSLNMYRQYSGEVTGTIEFKGKQGKVELILTEQNMRDILKVCAARLIEQSTEAANNLTSAVIEATKTAELTVKE